ncbi:MAG: Tol-Pal system beta propeller repeat protein TolB [Hydrotalea sp.]|nr:Tol-Pal system beta propeller repeat protein TolB [Hydrotalea sp.]
MRANHRFLFFCFGVLALFLTAAPAMAVMKMTIRQGTIKTINLAIGNVAVPAKDSASLELANKIVAVIANDLSGSGLFQVTSGDENPVILGNFATPPVFSSWQKLGNQFLFQTEVTSKDNKIIVRAKLWDIIKRKNILEQNGVMLSTDKNNWRRLAHQLSDDIYTRLTGEKPYFDSRIIFIAETGSKKQRVKQLAIIDQDGENLHYISNGRYLVLTPRFSNNLQKISYMSYQHGEPEVYILDVETGANQQVGSFGDSMTFAPRFSPDNKKIIFSLEQDGASNIYVKPLDGSAPATPLTTGGDINTSPCYSPDGRFITFTSDRDGTPQIYVMTSDGKNPRRISYGAGEYSTPVWSPRGDYIAFTKQSNNIFYIGVVKPDGRGERLLSESFLDEGPTWSPNGRVIAFFRQKTAADDALSLWTVDVTGNFLKKIILPVGGSDPAWSPLTAR